MFKSTILAGLVIAGLALSLHQRHVPSVEAVKASSANVALVPGPCGAFGGAGCMPTSGFSAGYAPSFTNVPTSTLPSVINNYDTVVLLQICDIGQYLDDDTWRDPLINWISAGGKLIIYDSDACGTLTLDYSNFVYPFTTNNPCQCGSNQGTLEDVEDNTLSSTDPSSLYYVDLLDIQNNTDAVGDASVMLTQDANWKGDLKATNVNNFEGFTHTYAEYGSGLVLYNGLDSDVIGSNVGLQKLWEFELKQQWDPSDLPGSTPVAGCIPDDEAFDKQWHLKAIDVVGAWQQFPDCDPAAVNIAVIDTGVNAKHEDLAGRITAQTWYVTNDGDDQFGHGTEVSGLIGANRNNGIDIAGVSPNAAIHSYKVLATPQAVGAQTIRDLGDAIRSAVDDGAQVINMSLGTKYDWHQIIQVRGVGAAVPCFGGCANDGFLGSAIKYARDHDVIIVAASGNTGNTETYYPAAYASTYWNVIAVAASNVSGKAWTNKTCVKGNIPFTQQCASSTTGTWVTLSAPGGIDEGVKACDASKDDCIVVLARKSGTTEGIGTSLAAPQVTGVVALMIAANLSIDRQHIRQLLQDSATPFAATPARPSGVGVLNAAKAVKAAKSD